MRRNIAHGRGSEIDGAHPLIVSLVDFDRNSDEFPSMWSRKQCMDLSDSRMSNSLL